MAGRSALPGLRTPDGGEQRQGVRMDLRTLPSDIHGRDEHAIGDHGKDPQRDRPDSGGSNLSEDDLKVPHRSGAPQTKEIRDTMLRAMQIAGCAHPGPLSTTEVSNMLNARTAAEREADARDTANRIERGPRPQHPPAPPEHGQGVATIEPPTTSASHIAGEQITDQEQERLDDIDLDKIDLDKIVDGGVADNHTEPAPAEPDKPDESAAEKLLESWRWPDGITCPACGSDDIRMGPKSMKDPHRCGECGRIFGLRTVSPMSKTRTPASAWVQCIQTVVIDGKRLSGAALARETGISLGEARNITKRVAAGHKRSGKSTNPTKFMNSGDINSGAIPAEGRHSPREDVTAPPIEPQQPGPEANAVSPPALEHEANATVAIAEPTTEQPAAMPGLEDRVSLLEITIARMVQQGPELETMARLDRIITKLEQFEDRQHMGNGQPPAPACPNCGTKADRAQPTMQCRRCGCGWAIE